MAGSRIKGITVEIGGDTTKLQTALKGVNSEIKNTQSQLKDVEKLLKLDPGNTELLAQKLLSDAVSETMDKLTTLKTAAEQANTAIVNGNISQEQYDALQREIIETENDLKKLEAQANQSATALQKISATGEKLKTVGNNISSVGEKMLPATAAITGLGTAAVTTAANFESSMSQVQATMGVTKDAMSTVDGQSVNTMDTLSELAKKMGAETAFSAKECAGAEGGTHLRNIILSLQSPTGTAAKQMEALGLSVYGSEGNMRSLNDICPLSSRSTLIRSAISGYKAITSPLPFRIICA